MKQKGKVGSRQLTYTQVWGPGAPSHSLSLCLPHSLVRQVLLVPTCHRHGSRLRGNVSGSHGSDKELLTAERIPLLSVGDQKRRVSCFPGSVNNCSRVSVSTSAQGGGSKGPSTS